MPARTPTTLWRYIFWELTKLIAITTLVLVTIISFAASVRWVANGSLGPIETLKFAALASIPMLAYALPFAASFGATLTYHRMATDNEVTAAYAGGIGHRRVLFPALIMGLTLAGGLAALNEQIIPRFLRHMEEMITEDLTNIVFSTIKRGDSLNIGNVTIQAEDIIRIDPNTSDAVKDSGATDWMVLSRCMAIQTNDQGEITGETTAREAHVFFFPSDVPMEGALQSPLGAEQSRGYAVVHLIDSVGVTNGRYARSEETRLPPVEVPYRFSDDPKFLTSGQLVALREHPENMSWVEGRRRNLAMSMATSVIISQLRDELASAGRVSLISPDSSTRTIHASQLTRDNTLGVWLFQPLETDGPIVVDEIDPNANTNNRHAVTTRLAGSAELHINKDDPQNLGMSIRIELHDVSTPASPGAAPEPDSGDRRRLVYTGLTLPADPLAELLASSPSILLDLEAQRRDNQGEPSAAAKELDYFISRLNFEVTSKQHERAAMAVSCLIMVLCGSIIALRLVNARPLAVYLWSFFPALGCVISISTGQQWVQDFGAPGLAVLWLGVAALSVYTYISYRTLRAH